MIAREISPIAARLATQYPVLTVTGPRQSGKTTLCKQLFISKPYVSLEDIETRRYATDDPRGFLAQFPDGAILDEIQKCPDLFSYIQTIVDQKKNQRDVYLNRKPAIRDASKTFTILGG